MTVEEAITIATEYVNKLFQGSDFRLEEVELGDSEAAAFVITISFRPPGATPSAVTPIGTSATSEVFGRRRAAIGVDASRVYKDVVVGNDGRVRAVRMRQIVVG
jgi:hypothetical protein